MHTPFRFMTRRAAVLWAVAVLGTVTTAVAQEVSGPDAWAANCGGCHRLRSVAAHSASQWNSIATHMGLVARLTPAQTRAVREFLVSSAQSRQAAATARELAPPLASTPAETSRSGASFFELQAAQSSSQAPTSGREIYRTRCAACHGPEGRGNGPAAAAMNPRPTSFADSTKRQARTDFAVGEVIEHGRRSMPGFGRTLSRAQLDSVIAHVKTLSR